MVRTVDKALCERHVSGPPCYRRHRQATCRAVVKSRNVPTAVYQENASGEGQEEDMLKSGAPLARL